MAVHDMLQSLDMSKSMVEALMGQQQRCTYMNHQHQPIPIAGPIMAMVRRTTVARRRKPLWWYMNYICHKVGI